MHWLKESWDAFLDCPEGVISVFFWIMLITACSLQ